MVLLPVIMALAGISPARAADGLSFVRRDYDLQIQRNGDVSVAERWQVHFGATAERAASLGVFLTHAQTVEFDHVTGADPNSEQVASVTDSQGHAIEQISWTFPAAHDETRAFTIPYTLHGAIAQNQTQAWLDRHFFDGPAAHENVPVAATQVMVTLPAAGGDVQVKSDYAGSPLQISHPSDAKIVLDGQNLDLGKLLEVEVIFPRAKIDATVQRPKWQHSDAPPNLPTKLDVAAATAPNTSIGPTNPIGGFFANVGLVLVAGLVIVAILGFVAWRLAKRLAADIRNLGADQVASGGEADADDPDTPFITKPLPAIDLNFGEVEWPKSQEELDLEALGLHPLEAGASGPISRVGLKWDEHESDEPKPDSTEAERGTGATSGVGSNDGD